jgi:predicted secreted protein
MADVRGKDFLIMVGDTATSPTTYGILEGQTSGTFDGTVDFADTTAKDTGSWTTSAATTRSGNVSVAGNLRDVASRPNFELLRTAWLTGETHACQVILDEEGNGFSGDFYVQISTTGDVRDVGKYTMELRPRGALAEVVPTP